MTSQQFEPAPAHAEAVPATASVALTAEALARIDAAVRNAKAPTTSTAYRSDWDRFTRWCRQRGYPTMPAPPEVIADYLTEHAEAVTPKGERAFAISTLRRWLAGINYVHRNAGQPVPGESQLVRETVSGMRRAYASVRPRAVNRKAPLMLDDLTHIIATARTGADTWRKRLTERRDSALLLLAWVGAFRRSEVVEIRIADVVSVAGGLQVDVRRSKTDQYGVGSIKVVPRSQSPQMCAPCAIVRWCQVLRAADTQGRAGAIRLLSRDDSFDEHVCAHGLTLMDIPDPRVPLIRAISRNGLVSDRSVQGVVVHQVLRRRAAAAGWDDEALAGLGGHSPRAGFATEAAERGESAHAIASQTGHRSMQSVEVYIRHKSAWDHNAATRMGM